MQLRHGAGDAVAGNAAVVHVGAHLGVPQRHQATQDLVLQRLGQPVHQAALLAEAVGVLGGFLHPRPALHIGAIEVLARVGDRMPVGHADRRAGGIVELALRVPQRPIMEVGGRLDVVAGFLITAGRLVAETTLQIAVGMAEGFRRIRLDLYAHFNRTFLLCIRLSLVLTLDRAPRVGRYRRSAIWPRPHPPPGTLPRPSARRAGAGRTR